MTGNTWDIIKIQTKTNQLMMGNRKDHIRVRGQRQRKTKSDIANIWVKIIDFSFMPNIITILSKYRVP